MLCILLIMAVSISTDAFGIGLSYELKEIHISPFARFLTCVVYGMVMFSSMLLGKQILRFLPPEVSQHIGTVFLFLSGVFFIIQAVKEKSDHTCDLNNSKDISVLEALLLGLIMSLDSISGGIAAAAMQPDAYWFPACVALIHYIFLSAGKMTARLLREKKKPSGRLGGVLAGSIMIVLGISHVVGG